VNIELNKSPRAIGYSDKILLVGSCFTEHIGNTMQALKFSVLQNPHGILFDPASITASLKSYIKRKQYRPEDLFFLNEAWHSWDHHSRFSHPDRETALVRINESQEQAHRFLREANWLMITLGSAFSYRLRETGQRERPGVANCHRAPAQWFDKTLLEINEITYMLDYVCQQLREFNPGLGVIFTVSPVRHIRDGVIANNRSKARLLETVHYLVNKFENFHYFPAYELVIDVLRDYRFYDIDLVHPNYMATEYVFEKFSETCISAGARELMSEMRSLITARKHRPAQPDSRAHAQFLKLHFEKALDLARRFPFLDLSEELKYFSQG